MTKGSRFTQHGFIIILFLLSITVGGCLPLLPTDTPVTCASASPNANIYQAEPQGSANIIFEYAHPPTPVVLPSETPDPANTPMPMPSPAPTSIPIPEDVKKQQIQNARYEAFQYLIKEAKRWSDIETIKFNDASEAEIVITFISPELLQAVLLNNTLKDGVLISDFQTKVQETLNSVAAREELLFMFTVTAPGNNTSLNNHVLKVQIGNLVLNNAESVQLAPSHYDPNLGQPINSSSESVFGYIAYPQVSLLEGQCRWTLDPKYNTNIVVTIPTIEVDGVSSGPYSWTISYAPLLNLEEPPEFPLFIIPPGYDQSQMSPFPTPPTGIKQGNRWQDFARFVWFKTTLRY
jgi:hypothetical protein